MFQWIKYMKELQSITSDVSYLVNRTKDYSHRGNAFSYDYTYIYMDKGEYKIDQVYLHNPEFIRTNEDDVIMIKDVFCDGTDYKRVKEYTVDLEHRTYIVTKNDVLKE